ncbi:hypothetical protein HBI65_112140 [Parastagonospora nodorum]|nr:hypothetical protein HBH42_060680 [Parastagonospora nodorum]KAH4583316.1 hypothetical protein HBH84_029410 [Parastagonospora nodorum]KAH4791603.1 hypothetical protein HBH63_097460 [Parastagonospora nodorum]KAH5012819.1 hypothetical protein HBI77_074810 [Parastagonospora nodorum]KAH5082667.1 hypothetical protein HBH95_047020 [Parastagonospora nodorum]
MLLPYYTVCCVGRVPAKGYLVLAEPPLEPAPPLVIATVLRQHVWATAVGRRRTAGQLDRRRLCDVFRRWGRPVVGLRWVLATVRHLPVRVHLRCLAKAIESVLLTDVLVRQRLRAVYRSAALKRRIVAAGLIGVRPVAVASVRAVRVDSVARLL